MRVHQLRSTSVGRDKGYSSAKYLQSAPTPRRVRVLARSRDDDAAPEPPDLLQETITFLTADGIVRIPGRMLEVPHSRSSRTQQRQPMPSWDEQRLCIGQTFEVAAWNAR
eukprot:GHRQ01020567.1.p2 GENE.GHRQ01020567.1~~GHRQ01020567.1.p2  ORF type:complete len:110 (+),score=18.68 GHRQ01020567.1:445-774(+)